MAYVVLAVAILSEVLGTISLKFVDGLARPVPLILVVIGYGCAFVALANVLKMGLTIGVTYAIWSGAGVALVAAVGALFLNERMTAVQFGGIALIIAGVVALEVGGAR